MFGLGETILALLEVVFGFWNNQVNLVFELLGSLRKSLKEEVPGE